MSTVNYYQASQFTAQPQRATQPLEIGFEFQPVMKGARLGYGAAVLLMMSLIASFLGIAFVKLHVILLIAATIQTIGLLLMWKIPAASRAVPLLTAALVLFGSGTMSMLISVAMIQLNPGAITDYLLMTSVMLWGIADVFLLLGLCRIGMSVNQPSIVSNAKFAMLMLGITYTCFVSLFLLLLNPSLMVELNLASNQESLVRFVQFSLLIISILTVIGLFFYIRSVSVITRLVQFAVAQRATKTNFAELGQVNVPVRGREMDFLQI